MSAFRINSITQIPRPKSPSLTNSNIYHNTLMRSANSAQNQHQISNMLNQASGIPRHVLRPVQSMVREPTGPTVLEPPFSINSYITPIDDDMSMLKETFSKNKRLKINNFLLTAFANSLYKGAVSEKNWVLSTGINKNKYEKSDITQFDKINRIQLKNVSEAFGKDEFAYGFYRTMNNNTPNYIEYTVRKVIGSDEFIKMLNEITELGLTKLTTLFMSKYKSGNFLSPHSDKGNGRLAFVVNLSKFWKPQYGGALHFLNDERTEVIDTFVPDFNNLVIFYVPEPNGIPHFVSHVCPNVKPSRYAITGWFE